MRVVLDTNVLLAGLATHGLCEVLLDSCLGSKECVVVLSEYILEELSTHLQGKFAVPPDKVGLSLKVLRGQVELVEPAEVQVAACRDPDDLPILGTLISANADCLVTGDGDLLALGQFQGKPIFSPRQFYQQFPVD